MELSWMWLILILLFWLAITTWGSLNISANYFVNGYHKNHLVNENEVALTFDDGPNETFTPRALDLLKSYGMKATFFCTGKQVEAHPELVKRIINEGHVIGNHSYGHDLGYGFFSTNRVIDDIKKNQNLIFAHTSLKPRFFRPPFGVTNPNISKAVRNLKLTVIGWSVRPFDTAVKNPDRIYQRIVSRIKPGDVILLHDTHEPGIRALEAVLQFFKKHNLISTTVDQLINIRPYEQ